MSKNNFTRTNVDVRSLEVSAPKKSSFDKGCNDMFSIPFGRLFPVRCTKMMTGSSFKGGVNVDLNLEKFATPMAGRMRLDTHTFVVPIRRVHNGYRQYYESILHGGNAESLPCFTLKGLIKSLFRLYTGYNSFAAFWTAKKTGTYTSVNKCYSILLDAIRDRLISLSDETNGKLSDWYLIEKDRIVSYQSTITITNNDISFGDFIYNVLKPYIAEGSILDSFGYDIYDWYSVYHTLNDVADSQLKVAKSGGSWDQTKCDAYFAALSNMDIVLQSKGFENNAFVSFDSACYPVQCELPLRANYSVWYDWFRNFHLETCNDVLNPDNFGSVSIITDSQVKADQFNMVQLLVVRSRNWSRDGFTMVQPDDVYRHVYAPAPANSATTELKTYDSIPSLTDVDSVMYYAYDQTFSPSSPLLFPSTFFGNFKSSDSDSASLFLHDLQTMRRANMLESYLRRNYYNPDTFVGQIEARFGVKPDDYKLLTAQYVGGDEMMISGEQIVSNNQVNVNDVTPVGQRTLMANAKCGGNFSYFVSDASYVISYVSIVPLIHYNKRDMNLHELTPNDECIPEFANDNRVIIRSCDMLRDFNVDGLETPLGYVPRYYGYRMAMDGVHGKFLREYRNYTWLRDRVTSGQSMLTKTAENEHINLPLDCFQNLKPWDTVAFGSIDLPLIVECALPAKLEYI